MSRGGNLLLDSNPKGGEVSEHIATKFEVNTRMLSTLKNAKSILNKNPGEDFETSVVRPLRILATLVNIHIGHGYSNSGRFLGDLPRFISLTFILVW